MEIRQGPTFRNTAYRVTVCVQNGACEGAVLEMFLSSLDGARVIARGEPPVMGRRYVCDDGADVDDADVGDEADVNDACDDAGDDAGVDEDDADAGDDAGVDDDDADVDNLGQHE